MKRILCIVLAFMFMFGAALSEGETKYINEPKGAWMRAGADYSAEKIIPLWCGEPATVIGTAGNFTYIATCYGLGYVSSELLSFERPKSQEMYQKMAVNLDSPTKVLNVRPIPYFDHEYPNTVVDRLENGKTVIAINQCGPWVEIVYASVTGDRHGYVYEDCLKKVPGAEPDATCARCGRRLDKYSMWIETVEGGEFICSSCYRLGACVICGHSVYADQDFIMDEHNRYSHCVCAGVELITLPN